MVLQLICILASNLFFFGCNLTKTTDNHRPIIVFTFDDQHISIYDKAFPIMQEFGFPGTNFVNSGRIGNPQLMSWDQVIELDLSYGWETGGHTIHHSSLTTQSQEEAEYAIEADFTALKRRGLSVKSFALPSGQCPLQYYPIITNLYQNIRGSFDFSMYNPINRYSLGYLTFQSSWNASQIKDRIVRGIALNESLIIIGFHKFDVADMGYQDSCTSESFREILQFVADNNLEVKTLHNAVESLE